MKRTDFMNQLESLLQSIPSTEREEAMQYYNDYFDDAGAENEQQVIEALGNPARVAENIKRDLLGSAEGEAAARKVRAEVSFPIMGEAVRIRCHKARLLPEIPSTMTRMHPDRHLILLRNRKKKVCLYGPSRCW